MTNFPRWVCAGLLLIGCSPETLVKDHRATHAPSTDMPKALRAAYVASMQENAPVEYAATRINGRVRFDHPAQRFVANVDRNGLTVTPNEEAWHLALRTTMFGCESAMAPVAEAPPEAFGNRVELRHEGLTEWYLHGPLGVEHGYDVPASPCAGAKRITLAVEGDVTARLDDPDGDAKGEAVRWVDAHERPVVAYSELFVTDARGAEVPAWFTVDAGNVVLVVDDAAATYPLRIDPLIWLEQAKLGASDGAAGDIFGISVALSGDTAIVGAYSDDVGANFNQGSAYVFVRNGATWTQQQKLTASDGAAEDRFGASVALSGDTAIVGSAANFIPSSAYVFVRNGATWTQQQKLTASDGAAGDEFGISVALSGDTAIVGAFYDDVGANQDQGSAYLFVRNGATWTQQQKLTASDGAAGDLFGRSVAVSGDTAIVGRINSAYVFVRNGATWTEQQKLTASDGAPKSLFGTSVALSGDTAIVGADYDDVGEKQDQGSAYVFVRSGAVWSQQQKLTASDGALGDLFGYSVALSGDTAIVGAIYGNGLKKSGQGSAYVFVRSGTVWSQQQKLTASDGAATDLFGNSVALSGGMAIVGALYKEVGANQDQGSAYVFVLDVTNGNACTTGVDCLSGFCIDGVCCNVACGGGDPTDCQACSIAAGAAIDGICGPVADATTCANGECFGGSCVPDTDGDGHVDLFDNCSSDANPLQSDTDNDGLGNTCDADDDNDGFPDSLDGCPLISGPTCPCANPVQPPGTPCDDLSECTTGDVCDGNGTCIGTFSAICPAEVTCQQNWCNPKNGVCSNLPLADATPCPGGMCIAGGCYIDIDNSAPASSSSSSASGGMGGASSSSASSSGMGGAGGTMSGSALPEPRDIRFTGTGCSCSTAPRSNSSPAWPLLALLAGLTRLRSKQKCI